MTSPGVVLAVDVGTSGARAFSYDERYVIQATAGAPITTISGADGSSTQSWEQVRPAIAGSIREVAARSLAPVAAGTTTVTFPVYQAARAALARFWIYVSSYLYFSGMACYWEKDDFIRSNCARAGPSAGIAIGEWSGLFAGTFWTRPSAGTAEREVE